MAPLVQRVTGLSRGDNPSVLTVDFNYDSITFVVASIKVINPWAVTFIYTVTDNLGVKTPHTVAANQTDTNLLGALVVTLTSTLEFPSGWMFDGH